MEEIVSLIFHGGKLVKELEESLPNIANQPHVLISSCDEISRVFGNAREQLTLAVQDYGTHHESLPQMEVGGGSVPEWLRSSHATDMGGYYRCTHQKLYNCPAKKHVQRLNNDPYTFEGTYQGEHTCIMSSTAPSMPPPSLLYQKQ
ncbi:WRKY transcription factor 55-like [Cynara cardunculus var. scolymus]|uniref:WRKY transcription factor 55-like n=1 Tax=Cynara cardunculus var. scolymus TaxID=59895 RepID=UPI000D62D8E9|nr:WRKY transcription factor 55-like [Cynara cardunculus var. scolymus]